MPQVLFIAYYFPPAGNVGALRAARWVKYLPEHQWFPIVVTAEPTYYELNDSSLLEGIPSHTRICRTKSIEPAERRGFVATEKGGLLLSHRMWWEKLENYSRYHVLVPDVKVGWLPFAVREALSIIRGQAISAIVSTSYPYTAHLVGLILKLATRKPWVADFRDPWANYAYLFPLLAPTMQPRVSSRR